MMVTENEKKKVVIQSSEFLRDVSEHELDFLHFKLKTRVSYENLILNLMLIHIVVYI